MSAILIANDRDRSDLAIRHHPAFFVLLVQKCIHPLQRPFADAARLPQPDLCADEKDVGVKKPLADVWPVVAFPSSDDAPGMIF